MSKTVPLLLITFFVICNISASEINEECFNLNELIINGKPFIKGSSTCKYLDNFCTFTSKRKSLDNNSINIDYIQKIPCEEFEKYKIIRNCTLKYQNLPDKSKRYTLTKECILSKNK